MSNTTRQPGSYRVKYKGKWHFAEFQTDGGRKGETSGFCIPGYLHMRKESELDDIDPTPIDPNPAPQPAGQLTADKLYNEMIMHQTWKGHEVRAKLRARACVDIAIKYAAQQTAAQYSAMLNAVSLQEKAERETAAKDAEIAKLREKVEELHEEVQVMNGKFIRTNEGDKMHASYAYHEIASIIGVPEGGSAIEMVQQMVNDLDEKDARIKELEEAAERQEQLAYSIVQERDEVHGSLLMLLEEVPDENSAVERVIRQLESVKGDLKEKDARIAELEGQLKDLNTAAEHDVQDLNEQLETAIEWRDQYKEERDEAVRLLRYWLNEYDGTPPPETEVEALLSRIDQQTQCNHKWITLSGGRVRCKSGGLIPISKPDNIPAEYPGKRLQPLFDLLQQEHDIIATEGNMQDIIDVIHSIESPWISVEDRLPEPYTEVYAGSHDEDGEFYHSVCHHTGEEWEGMGISEDSMITHWAYTLSAPPESLTDK